MSKLVFQYLIPLDLTTKPIIRDIETELMIWEVKCEFQYFKGLNVIEMIV